MVAPIFSLFLPILAFEIGATTFEVGLVGGAENIVYAFMPFFMGHFTDRGRSRRFFIVSAFAMLAVVSLFYSIASNPIALIVARLFEGLGWAMLWPAIESSITIGTFGDSHALSLFNSSWSGGAAIGPLAGGFLIAFGSMRFAYVATTIMLGIALLVNLISTIRNREVNGTNNHKSESYSFVSALKNVFQSQDKKRNFQTRFYVSSLVLAFMTVGVLYTFFGPYAKTLGMSILLISAPPFFFGLLRFLIYLVTTHRGFRSRLLDPTRRNRTVFVALLIACSSTLLMLVRDPSGELYFVAFGLFAAGFSVVYFVSQVTMIAEVEKTQMGTRAGVFESVVGLGSAAGPIIAGAISSSSLGLAFLV
ncbi:MAG: MFS transporter, partial [Nitrososphaerales archaeon]